MIARIRLAVFVMFSVAALGVAAERVRVVELPPIPKAVSSFGAASIGDNVYIYGGHAGKAHQYSTNDILGTLHRLKFAPDAKWEALAGGPGLQGLALVSHQGKLIRIGGMQPRNKEGEPADNHSVDTVERFDPATNTWESLPALPAARSSHDAAVVGDRIYVVGGWKLSGKEGNPVWHDSMLMLDLAAKEPKWQSMPQPFQRRALTVSAYQGKVYVICGMTAEGELERTVNILDTTTGNWSKGPDVPGAKMNGFTPASSIANDRLIVSTADGKVYRLTAKGDAWEEVGTLQHPRFVHRMVTMPNGQIVVLGGASKKSGNVAVTELIGGEK